MRHLTISALLLGAACAGSGLRQLLCGHDAQREAGVDDPVRMVAGRAHAPLEQLAEADLAGVRQTVVEVVEGAAVVQVGRVHDVPGRPELRGEVADSRRQAVPVVVQQHLSHVDLLASLP
jgi:hypothetical protein